MPPRQISQLQSFQMAKQIQLQTEITTIGLQGLGAFSTVLATLSSDNISPIAAIQLEKLGAVFLPSGPFATRVPELLARSTAHPVGRLALAVGWRKGDSASLLASTSGGQAIALLVVPLANIFSIGDCGDILFQLCHRLLARDLATASMAQLANVTVTMADKLSRLGFGNFLAEQVVRLHNAYQALGISPPLDLLDCFTSQSAVELFLLISRGLREEESIVRIRGSSSMGHIIGVLLFLFPHDTVVTVEDVIVHEGEKQSLLVELRGKQAEPVTLTIETVVKGRTIFGAPLTIERESSNDLKVYYQFNWSGWLVEKLHLAFSGIGSQCTPDVLTTFCDLMVAVSKTKIPTTSPPRRENRLPDQGLIALMGLSPYRLMEKKCEEILRTRPINYDRDLKEVFYSFAKLVAEQIGLAHKCLCQTTCNFANAFIIEPKNLSKSQRACKANKFWYLIGELLVRGIMSFFINAGPGAVVTPADHRIDPSSSFSFGSIIFQALFGGRCFVTCERFMRDVLGSTVGRQVDEQTLICSSGSSTIYPTLLECIELIPDLGVSFELRDGQLNFDGRYHKVLSSTSESPRPGARKSIARVPGRISVSNMGAPAKLDLTVQETTYALRLRTKARYSGTDVFLDLAEIIPASFSLGRTSNCPHPATKPSVNSSWEVTLTSVQAPRTSKRNAIAIAMTHRDANAQLLCCEPGERMMLVRDCCIDCALEQAAKSWCKMLIVS